MKIVCDNCATKYSIADEKVRGKVFKIRCKKCDHVIVVRGGVQTSGAADGAATTDASYDGEDQTAIAGGPPPAAIAAASGDAVWHLVIDREQVGPMTPAEVRAKHDAGQIDAETYAWREGFGDWLRLGSIEDFKDLGAAKAAPEARTMLNTDLPPEVAAIAAQRAAAAPSVAHDAADVFASHEAAHDGGADLFGSAAPTAIAAPMGAGVGEDPFAAAASAPAPDFAAAAAAVMPSGASAGAGESLGASFGEPSNGASAKLTGQRNENSVLFSLNNLQALANPKPVAAPAPAGSSGAAAPKPGFASAQSEGSGLIDIRAMAQQTISASPTPFAKGPSSEPPSIAGAPVFSPVVAAPVLMPAPQSGMPKWIWGVIGGGVLVIGGIVVLLVMVLLKKPEPQQVVYMPQPGTLPGAVAAAPAAGTASKADTPAKADTPSAPVAAAEPDKGDKKGSSKGTKVAKADKGSSKKDDGAVAAAPTPPTTVAAADKPKKKPGGDTTLDDLLDGASPATKPARTARPTETGGGADDASLPEQLSRDDIKKGMTGVTPKAQACFQQYHVPGTALVSVMIAKSGRVQSADVKGVLAGTPTGDCVAKAVKTASFGKFKGAPMSVTYPFILR